jgi:hypothetical protein
MGALAISHSTKTKLAKPANPSINGTKTFAELKGEEMPPVVRPYRIKVTDATKMEIPR